MFKEKLKFAFYTLAHPSDGFYEIRHRNRGSVFLAILFVFLFGVSFASNRQYAGFVVNVLNPMSVNSPIEVSGVMILFLLFCIGNWSITCLMEGEGRFKDIITVMGYSILPMVLTFVPATILSHFLAQNEEAFYSIILVASLLYFLLLALIGIMTVHNFTLGKTLFTIVLTFVAMFIIIFLCLLFGSLMGQIINFFKSIYDELILRA
ncbi:MAG TPA: Yip1 family protein [Lachnospiraceae bacterium]|nr:Yip1 family protein [Lachnospiraceae bacterium]